MVLADEAGYPETEHQQQDIGKKTYAQKRENERAVGQFFSHYRREHQQGAGNIYHDAGKLLVKLVAHIAQLTGDVTQNHDDE